MTEIGKLLEICRCGISLRYPGVSGQKLQRIQARLFRELGMIRDLGIGHQLLVACDVARYARSQGILVGPGRGAIIGSLVAYLAGITGVDPIRHDLLAERLFFSPRLKPFFIEMEMVPEKCDRVFDYIKARHSMDALEHVHLLPFDALADIEEPLGWFGLKNCLAWDSLPQSVLDWSARQVVRVRGFEGIAKAPPFDCSHVRTFYDLVANLCLAQRTHAAIAPRFPDCWQSNYIRKKTERLFRETRGLLLYQEQVMLLLHGLGGIPFDEATGYLMEKAPSCLISLMNRQRVNVEARSRFMAGCERDGMSRDTADDLWRSTRKAGPFILKAHMVGLALVACWKAFLYDGKSPAVHSAGDLSKK